MRTTTNILRALTLMLAVIVFTGAVTGQMRPNAASPVQLTVTDAVGKAGDKVTVSISITSNSGVGAATLLLKYDKEKLLYQNKSEKYGPAKGELNVINVGPTAKYPDAGNIRTIYYGPVHSTGITDSGIMMSVVFEILPGWSGSTALTLTVIEFIEPNQYKTIPYTISNGSVSISGASTTTTTLPDTATVTTNPPASTKPAVTTTQIAGMTSSSTNTEQTTAVPVTVPVEDVIEALGPDGEGWDKNVASLNEEQKEKIEEYFADAGTPVNIESDGVYFLETTQAVTSDLGESTTSPQDNTGGMTTGIKLMITVAVVFIILAAALFIAYFNRKKSKEN